MSDKLSIRQFNPSFVSTETGCVSWIIDQTWSVVEYPAAALSCAVINKSFPADNFHFTLSLEKLTGQTALLLQINKFEHDNSP